MVNVGLHLDNIAAVILCGGRGSRLGGKDKGLVKLGEKSLISHVIAAVSPQVRLAYLVANRSIQEYEKLQIPVVSDFVPDYQGPLVGIYSAMINLDSEWGVFLPCDTPFLPETLIERLCSTQYATGADVVVVHDGVRMQNLCCLIRTSQSNNLYACIKSGVKSVGAWIKQTNYASADFSDLGNMFTNVNNFEDLISAEAVHDRQLKEVKLS